MVLSIVAVTAVVLLFASYFVVAEHQALAWKGVKKPKPDPVGAWHYQTRTEVHEEEQLPLALKKLAKGPYGESDIIGGRIVDGY